MERGRERDGWRVGLREGWMEQGMGGEIDGRREGRDGWMEGGMDGDREVGDGGREARTDIILTFVACHPSIDLMIVAHYDKNKKNSSQCLTNRHHIYIDWASQNISGTRKEKVMYSLCMRECDAKKTKSKTIK